MTASLWLTADGMAPKTGASVACEMGEDSAARVSRPNGRPTRVLGVSLQSRGWRFGGMLSYVDPRSRQSRSRGYGIMGSNKVIDDQV